MQKTLNSTQNDVRENEKILNIDPIFFWGIDVNILKWEKAYLFIISRIIERGGQKEINELLRFYGYDKIIFALQNEIRFLSNHSVNRVIVFFPELGQRETRILLKQH